MGYPDSDAYNQMFENASRHFVDSAFLNGAQPKKRKNGHGLVAWQGGLARVYAFIDKNGGQFIVRCWLTDPGNLTEGYFLQVSDYLRKHNLFVTTTQLAGNQSPPNAYFADFQFKEEGIELDGVKYPIMYMDWVEGEKLNQFIDNNYRDSAAIIGLADRFIEMTKHLHEKQISHGDLQNGNLIVVRTASGPKIVLIDYDSLYVPTLPANFSSSVIGYAGFQHPLRIKDAVKIKPLKVDYFSELIIFLSLHAIADNPNLWTEGTDQKLLFDNEDLVSPKSSRIFQELRRSQNSTVLKLADTLERFCEEKDLNNLDPLEKIATTEVWSTFREQLGVGNNAKASVSQNRPSHTLTGSAGAPSTGRHKSASGSDSVFAKYFSPAAARTKETHCPKCDHEFDKVNFYVICPKCDTAVYGLVTCPLCKDKEKIPKKSLHCPYCGKKPNW